MSTTVTYKGNTLTTVENATKKLTTAGTWLEDDITIQDTPSGGGSVVVVDTPDSHGGTIREITATNTVMLQGQKQVIITTSPQTIEPDSGYDGFESVVVPGGYTTDELAMNTEPSGAITLSDSVTQIKDYAFAGKPITSITGSYVTSISQQAFVGTNIQHIIPSNFPRLTGNTLRGFMNMASLLDIELTSAVGLGDGSGSIRGCSNVTSIKLPNANAVGAGNSALRDNPKLAFVDMGNTSAIGTACFYGDTLLQTLVLRRTDSICTLSGWNASVMAGIYNNPSSSTIYVPNALITTYQSATNWSSAYAAGLTFAKIEDSPYELT